VIRFVLAGSHIRRCDRISPKALGGTELTKQLSNDADLL
jgi:hypothetical protein